MLTGPEVKKTLKLAWPIMGAQWLWLSMSFVDSVMVGRLGAQSLAAMAIAQTFYSFCYVLAIGILSAMGPMVSSSLSAGRAKDIGPLVRQGMRLSLAMSLVILGVFTQSATVLRLLGQSEDLIPIASEYLSIVGWAAPAQVLYVCVRNFVEGTGHSRPSIVIVAVGAAMNVALDYAFIFGKWGAPAMGVAGSALATTVLSWAMTLILLIYVTLDGKYRCYRLWSGPFGVQWAVIMRLLSIGVPASLAMVSEMAFFVTSTLFVGTLGTSALAAHQIALNAGSLTFMIPLGLSMAVAIRVAHYEGARDIEGVKLAAGIGYQWVLIFQSISAFFFLAFPREVAGLYTTDPQLVELGARLLRIAGFFQIFDGLQVLGAAALRGRGDTQIPFVATLIAFWVLGFPFGWTLAVKFHWNVSGVWFGMIVGLGMASLLHYLRFRYLLRKPPVGVHASSPL